MEVSLVKYVNILKELIKFYLLKDFFLLWWEFLEFGRAVFNKS